MREHARQIVKADERSRARDEYIGGKIQLPLAPPHSASYTYFAERRLLKARGFIGRLSPEDAQR